jgi:hypothetical protein
MNTSVELSELLRRGDIPRLLNQEFKKERKPLKKPFEVQPQSSSSSVIKIEKRSGLDHKPDASDPNVSSSNESVSPEGTNRGEKRKEIRDDTPSPSLTLAVGLGPMPNGEVLHPFSPQNATWDNLWLEQDGSAHFRVFATSKSAEADETAVLQ